MAASPKSLLTPPPFPIPVTASPTSSIELSRRNSPRMSRMKERCRIPSRRYVRKRANAKRSSPQCMMGMLSEAGIETVKHGLILCKESLKMGDVGMNSKMGVVETLQVTDEFEQRVLLLDLDPATAKLVIPFIGPFLSAFGFLFILRIVMSWYPKLPVGKFPYVLAYAPTEPLLSATRKVIPPLGGVDVTPVVWFGFLSFLNEILVGPQGLLVLLSRQT